MKVNSLILSGSTQRTRFLPLEIYEGNATDNKCFYVLREHLLVLQSPVKELQ